MTNENLIFLKDKRYKELRLNVGLIARFPLMVQFYVRDLKESLSRLNLAYVGQMLLFTITSSKRGCRLS